MNKVKSAMVDSVSQCLKSKPGTTSLGVALLFALLLIIYRALTINLSLCSGASDCVKYTEMARSFASGQYGSVEFPFNLRIMAPWLASVFSQDVAKGFVWINGASALLFIVFCFKISRLLELRNAEFLVLVLWFFLHPLGFGFYYPVPQSVDPLSYAFMGLITFLFVAERRLLLWGAVLVALSAKESFSFIALIITAAELIYIMSTRDKRAVPALASVCGAVLILFIYKIEKNLIETYLFPQSQEWEITTFSTITWWLNEVWHDPKRLVVWLGAFFCSTGFFSILIFEKKHISNSPLKTRLDAYLALGGVGFVALGLLAGSDMSRIIFNGNLFILLAILFSFKTSNFPIGQLLFVLVFSLLAALNYTNFFPAAFEYDYYTQDHRIGPIICYVSMVILIMSCLWFLFKILYKNNAVNIRNASR